MQNPESCILLTKEDFLNSAWNEVIENATSKDCAEYYRGFEYQASLESDERRKQALLILRQITFPYLRNGDKTEPYEYQKYLEKIPNSWYATLLDFLPEIDDEELKARIADSIWITQKKPFTLVAMIVDGYIKSSQNFTDKTEILYSSNVSSRLSRALILANQVNNSEVKSQSLNAIKQRISQENGFYNLQIVLLETLVNHAFKDLSSEETQNYVNLSEQIAHSYERDNNFHAARRCWQLTIDWYRKLKDSDKVHGFSVNHAESYVKEANFKLSLEEQSKYFVAASFLTQAIEAFRKIKGQQERVEDIHKQLLECQEKSVNDFKSFTQSISIESAVEQVVNKISGKSKKEALENLAFICSSMSLEYLKQETQKQLDKNYFYSLFPPSTVNSLGKTIGINPSFDDEVYRTAAFYQSHAAVAIIEPARHQILLEHNITINDFYGLVLNNPFIENGREEIYAEGFLAGMKGDFLVSTHLLIPQIEHSLRYLLYRHGEIASFIDTDNGGIQDEYLLSVLLRDEDNKLKNIIGENLLFDLTCLLNRKGFGYNLRNTVCHGFLNISDFSTNSPPSIYLWWLSIRMCLLGLHNQWLSI